MGSPLHDQRWTRTGAIGSRFGLRLLGSAVVASLLLLAPASAGRVEAERCPFGAISAIGPVDAEGNGDTTPDVACIAREG